MIRSKLLLSLALFTAVAGAGLAMRDCRAETPMGATQMRTSSAAIETADVDKAVGWYRDNLGFRVAGERSTVHGRRVVLARESMLIEVAEHDAPVPRAMVTDVDTTASLPGQSLSLLVADVDAEIERLSTRGVTILAEPDDELDGRFRTGWIRDSEGRAIELREPLGQGSGDRP
jgi:catechol 2,3-dioxygenase-like lactoylglutathione lyase family enzyme